MKEYFCQACKVKLPSEVHWKQHKAGKKHRKNARLGEYVKYVKGICELRATGCGFKINGR